MARLFDEYKKNIKPNLMKELGLKNIFSVPEIMSFIFSTIISLTSSLYALVVPISSAVSEIILKLVKLFAKYCLGWGSKLMIADS